MLTRTGAENGQMELSLGLEGRVFQVNELSAAIQRLFETDFRRIWVAGEISGCRVASSGHYYFCLKDSQSQLKCAFFKGAARLARFIPRDGLAVLARGSLEVYEARGEYQLIVELLQPQGAGALQLAFEQLKKKLAAEGLFEKARKRVLPRLPRRIGIVTSPSGAVLRDMLQILERRFQGLHVRLYPAQVQGEGSVEQVSRALNYFSANAWADVVILARGGGSLEDLWTFNEEALARVIAACKVPVVSAIGHETDFTIADFVADFRAPTPSAAAEIIVCTRESLLEQIAVSRAKAAQSVRYRLLSCSRDLHQRGTDRAATLLNRALAKRAQRVDDLDHQLRERARGLLQAQSRRLAGLLQLLHASDVRLRLARNRHRQQVSTERMTKAMQIRTRQARHRGETIEAHLTHLSPLGVLARGYAIVEDARRHILRSSAETSPGEPLHIRLHRGELDAIVSRTAGPK
jgi:exodeoxyribonuclease VII large subunit